MIYETNLDFLRISVEIYPKKGVCEIIPKFVINDRSDDIMIRGGDFYAVWVKEKGLWSVREQDAIDLIDAELKQIYMKEKVSEYNRNNTIVVKYLWDASNGMIDHFHKYCQKQCRDFYIPLDEKLLFSNSPVNKKDYASKRLPYPLEAGDISAYETIISTLYSPEERHKIEWAIGSIVCGDSKRIQKYLVFYGEAGTGKSTIINIIEQLFEGYYVAFDAKALGSSNNSFALESFRSNPLVAIQHDGDLSKIEDNTKLNSLVSHEIMTVNEKFKSTYTTRFNAFLFMGSNHPVRITDSKSGSLRRLIDVEPTGNLVPEKEYNRLMNEIPFELGAIAYHCQDVYLKDKGYYNGYVPFTMMGATNDFYNFVLDSYHVFNREDATTLDAAWQRYKAYCDDAKITYGLSKRPFSEELRSYFHTFTEEKDSDGFLTRVYRGFKKEKFNREFKKSQLNGSMQEEYIIDFQHQKSIFDETCSECFAQLANEKETPMHGWDYVRTYLRDIDTSKLHYVKLPENHIVIDFDIPDETGEKSFEKNLKEASKWPKTYAELSKSGKGIHLHYIYTGDPTKLARLYADHIEIKVFSGKSSLRRCLTKCNNLPIAQISSGLPMKEEKKVLSNDTIQSETGLRKMIKKNLNKEIHPATKPSVDFIKKILDDAYKSGLVYDVTDMRPAIIAFAASSTNQAPYCLSLIDKMEFASVKPPEPSLKVEQVDDPEEVPIVFFDVEVFPNLFVICYKFQGKDKPVMRMINPTSSEVEKLFRYRLIGFNCRQYDNHILYAAAVMGFTPFQLYNLSQKIIGSKKGERNSPKFGQAYNLSYTDIYDFASAANKKSLKKLEIEMGIHHKELGMRWDSPVPEDKWILVAEYCDNDVIATEAAFDYLSADWTARQILAEITGMSVNDTTNNLSTRFIFGDNKKPQNEFNWRDLSKPVPYSPELHKKYNRKTFRIFDNFGQPTFEDYVPGMELPEGYSVLPFFPGYTCERNKETGSYVSTYKGEIIGEGGRVYSEPGMYGNIALLDIASQHPSSAKAEWLFGRYTQRYIDILQTRLYIKHGDYDAARKMFDGKLAKYLQDEKSAKSLANALKTVINSVYGLTKAGFENAFRDPRNYDNIVAKRGALFMQNLIEQVQKRGFTVAHIKTDSIKIPDATPEIIQFVMDYGAEFGYTFEHEETYDRMCLVDKAVYIAKYKTPHIKKNEDGTEKEIWWTATGKQFAIPYVFKSLFSHEEIVFDDLCITFETKKGDLQLDTNESMIKKVFDDANPKYLVTDLNGYYRDFELVEKVLKKDTEHFSDITIDNIRDLHFIGRVGRFSPIKPGRNGGILYQVQDGKCNAASGTKGYRWLESEMIRELGRESDIDMSYFEDLVNTSKHNISVFGDFEWLVSDDPYISPEYDEKGAPIYEEEVPFC